MMKDSLALRTEDCSFAGMDDLPTPRLVVYRRLVEGNISRMRGYLEAVAPGSGFRHLRSHAKTHKSAWATRRLLESGVGKAKCTPHELDMLLESGVRDVLVAYPLMRHQAERLAARVREHPDATITAQVGCLEHAALLAAAARRHGVEIDYYIDLDIGEHRTGVAAAAAPALAREIRSSRELDVLKLRGLHAYNGDHAADATRHREEARANMEQVVRCLRDLEAQGQQVGRLVVGGSPDFRLDLDELLHHHRVDADVDVSPGTWIYWDSKYATMMPDTFDVAALILAQVMDRTAADLVTLNLGYKRWAIDQGPPEVFSTPGLEAVKWSEEHTVLRTPAGCDLGVGDRVFLAPRHVCATVNLWEDFSVVGVDGGLEEVAVAVTARNR